MVSTPARIPSRSSKVPRWRRALARHPLAAFVGLAYALSWSWWIPLAASGATIRAGVGWPTHMMGLTGPLLAAVIVTWLVDGRTGLRELWRGAVAWRVGWWWLAVLVPLIVGVVCLALNAGAAGVAAFASYPGVGLGLGAAATFAYVALVNGLGEEVGWRGFATKRLLSKYSLTTSSLLVALMWAPWHLPLFLTLAPFEALAAGQVAGWLVGIVAGSIVLTWLFRGSGGSILLVAVWHAVFDFTSAAGPTVAGPAAAIVTTLVILAAVAIVAADARARTARRRLSGHAGEEAAGDRLDPMR